MACCELIYTPSKCAALRNGLRLGQYPAVQMGIRGSCTGLGSNWTSANRYCAPWYHVSADQLTTNRKGLCGMLLDGKRAIIYGAGGLIGGAVA